MISASELRSKTPKELEEQLLALRREQFQDRINLSTGQFAQVSKFREIRRDIARVKTVLNEKRRNG